MRGRPIGTIFAAVPRKTRHIPSQIVVATEQVVKPKKGNLDLYNVSGIKGGVTAQFVATFPRKKNQPKTGQIRLMENGTYAINFDHEPVFPTTAASVVTNAIDQTTPKKSNSRRRAKPKINVSSLFNLNSLSLPFWLMHSSTANHAVMAYSPRQQSLALQVVRPHQLMRLGNKYLTNNVNAERENKQENKWGKYLPVPLIVATSSSISNSDNDDFTEEETPDAIDSIEFPPMPKRIDLIEPGKKKSQPTVISCTKETETITTSFEAAAAKSEEQPTENKDNTLELMQTLIKQLAAILENENNILKKKFFSFRFAYEINTKKIKHDELLTLANSGTLADMKEKAQTLQKHGRMTRCYRTTRVNQLLDLIVNAPERLQSEKDKILVYQEGRNPDEIHVARHKL